MHFIRHGKRTTKSLKEGTYKKTSEKERKNERKEERNKNSAGHVGK